MGLVRDYIPPKDRVNMLATKRKILVNLLRIHKVKYGK